MGNLLNVHQAGDRPLELLVLNEEFLVSASHQLALITSLPFVHTARRSYRLDDPVKMMDRKDTRVFFFITFEPYYLEEGEVVTRYP